MTCPGRRRKQRLGRRLVQTDKHPSEMATGQFSPKKLRHHCLGPINVSFLLWMVLVDVTKWRTLLIGDHPALSIAIRSNYKFFSRGKAQGDGMLIQGWGRVTLEAEMGVTERGPGWHQLPLSGEARGEQSLWSLQGQSPMEHATWHPKNMILDFQPLEPQERKHLFQTPAVCGCVWG